ncbi:Secreted protein containing bacterial Ig-like domain and vWFA domain [Mycobacterium rhizamassiliense]|uniref:Secreted protein containing bacterial Ig-like domain and vWFA domain n=1 Tax=Mycobacterium rhizamassiliense TaxID=1841860 RepID=A0A2U3NX06_9MYCO|nr:hypothetical protein [Mycobacterium rhizamassiliense]SPM36046.1 Secreted protein containing bacterial Ig-like domain and vWFA domain [Mycobacterium rhizamassiliense]
MTFQPLLPWAIFAVVAGALAFARLVSLRQVLVSAGTRRVRAVLRWGGITLAVLLVLVAATRPAIHEKPTPTMPAAGENLNVFLIVDRSVEVGAENNDIAALLKQYPAARYALITFASRVALDWPLSADVWSLRPVIAAFGSAQGGLDVNAAAANTVLRYQLMQAAQEYPGSRNVVFYFGSGAPGSRAPQGDFDLTHGSVAGGAVLGYGRGDAINEAELRQIAGQLDVPYVHRDPGQTFGPLLPEAPGIRSDTTEPTELYWLAALLAAALLIVEIYLSVRQFRRGRIARRDLTT